MGKLKKYLASISVFMINLILMGVGFLFIKNHDESKKQEAKSDFDSSADAYSSSKKYSGKKSDSKTKTS